MVQTTDSVAEIQISYRPAITNKPKIVSALDAYVLFKEFFDEDTIGLQESFMVMYLNRSNRVLGIYPVSVGGITGTLVDLRLILSVALKTASTGIVLAHNHPSGNLEPSQSDIDITVRIKVAAKLFDIKLLDHLIITAERKFTSLANEGLI